MRLAKKDVAVEDGESVAVKTLVDVPEQFAVRDRASAEWLVRKLVEAQAHIDRVKVQATREIRRTSREREFLLMRYGPQLERWTREQLQQTQGRRKSVLLHSGTAGFRVSREKLVVSDLLAAIAWAKRRCGKAVLVIEKLSKSSLNEHIERTGELPPGVQLVPPQDTFYVK